MNPVAYAIAVRNVTDLACSALPDAPVVPDPAPRESRLRTTVAALLGAPARRRSRLGSYTRRPLQAG